MDFEGISLQAIESLQKKKGNRLQTFRAAETRL